MLHKISTVICLALVLFWGGSAFAQIFKMKHPPLKEKPAIVIAAFGTSTKAQVTFDLFDKQLRHELPGYEIRWAFTSDIIRAKMNKIYAKKRLHKRLYSLQEVLAKLEAEGYRQVVVQPLHIFPG
ncbi:sirohydrochlorin cobaltochelatase, partial [Thermodesulfatator indicus]